MLQSRVNRCWITHSELAGVVMLLRELHKQAQAEGGAVYMLNGNHESLNVSGNFRYANAFCALLLHKCWAAMFILLVLDLTTQAGRQTEQCLLVYQPVYSRRCLASLPSSTQLLCRVVAHIQTTMLVSCMLLHCAFMYQCNHVGMQVCNARRVPRVGSCSWSAW